MSRSFPAAAAASALAVPGTATAQQEPIRIGILVALEGAFADGGGDGIRGVEPAFRTVNITIAGRRIETIIAPTDARPDTAVRQARKLIGQDRVDFIVGPLSGSEGIAIRDHARTIPDETCIDGRPGARETTWGDAAPNLFRFRTDRLQWGAGLGEHVVRAEGRRKIATVAAGYSFGHTNVMGFAIHVCGAAVFLRHPRVRIWILVEARIAKALGASRAPIREAIRRLSQEGLIQGMVAAARTALRQRSFSPLDDKLAALNLRTGGRDGPLATQAGHMPGPELSGRVVLRGMGNGALAAPVGLDALRCSPSVVPANGEAGSQSPLVGRRSPRLTASYTTTQDTTPLSGSACPASARPPPIAGARSHARAPSDAVPGRSSGHRIHAASGSSSAPSRRSPSPYRSRSCPSRSAPQPRAACQ